MEIRIRTALLVWILAWAAILLPGCGLADRVLELKTEVSQNKEETSRASAVEKKRKNKKIENEIVKNTEEEKQDTKPTETEEANDTDRVNDIFAEGEDLYADYYVYQTLDDETKQVYHEVLTAILGQQEEVELSTTDVDVLEEAYKAVCADNGGLFWTSGYVYTQYTRGKELIGMDFTPKYTMDYEARVQTQQQIDASVQELLAGISTTNSDYEKAKYVFEILVQNVDYDASAENNQNIISTFLNRATVCQGYACATQYLLRLLGIQSVIVTGNANGESHAWNLARLDNNYYFMDTTWGNSRYLDSSSQMEKYVNYNYLAVTSDEIGRTHLPDDTFPLPNCTSTDNNYFIRENRYFAQWDPGAVGAVLREAWDAGAESVAVKFSTPQIYGEALNYFIKEQHIAEYCEGISSIYYLEDKELYVLTFRFSHG